MQTQGRFGAAYRIGTRTQACVLTRGSLSGGGGVVGTPPRFGADMVAYLPAVMHIICMYGS